MSFPNYPEYKDSGIPWVGLIPKHWDIRKLKTLFELMKRPPQESDDIVTAFRDGVVTLRKNRRSDGFTNSLQEIGYQGIHKDDLVIHAMDAFAGAIGVSDSDGKSTPVYSVCRSQSDEVKPHYYGSLLRNMALSGFISSLSKGIRERSTEFRWSEAGIVAVPHPTASEQSAIAAFLDRETAKIDALVVEQEKLIELLKEKRQAVISHAVTKGLDPNVPMKDSGVEWLGEVPEHWGHPRKLSDLAAPERHTFVNGPFGSDLLTSELTTEGVPVIYIRDIKESGYVRVSEWCVTRQKANDICFCNVLPNDILIAKVGDPPGLAVVYPEHEPEGIVTQDVIRIRVDRSFVHPFFLRYCMNSDYGKAVANNISVESTRTRVSLGEYKTLRFVIPPLEEQIKISSYLDEITEKLNSLQIEAQLTIDLLKERRSALISAAVTGKIDVRGLTEATQ